MLAIDWSHTKDLAIYDGLLGGESMASFQSKTRIQPPGRLHIHNAALNRTATFLAKEVWRVVLAGESKLVVKSSPFLNPASTT